MIDQILEIYKIKGLKRTGWVHNNIDNPETVGSHSFGVGFLAFQLCPSYLNRGQVVEMALMHDIQESIVGDITPNCNVLVEDKHQRELAAIQSISQNLNNQDYLRYFNEYEEGQTKEGRFIKQCDLLDMFLQALIYEKQGHQLQQFFKSMKEGEFEEINLVIREIQAMRQ